MLIVTFCRPFIIINSVTNSDRFVKAYRYYALQYRQQGFLLNPATLQAVHSTGRKMAYKHLHRSPIGKFFEKIKIQSF